MAVKKSKKTTSRAKRKVPAARAKRASTRSSAESKALTLSSASPSFTVNDLEKSLGWYRDVLGFDIEETWKADDGEVVGVSLKAGNVTFMIGQDDWKKGRDRKKGEGFRLYCETKKSVDDLARQIEAKGGQLDSQPTDQPWGTRDITLTDPDGFKITIAVPKR